MNEININNNLRNEVKFSQTSHHFLDFEPSLLVMQGNSVIPNAGDKHIDCWYSLGGCEKSRKVSVTKFPKG